MARRSSHVARCTVVWAVLCTPLCMPAAAAVLDHQWCRYNSPYFELITDLPAAQADDLITHMERFRTVVADVMALAAPDPRRTKALAFARRRDFGQVFDTRVISGFMRPAITEVVLVFGPDRGGELTQNALHEYAHELLRSSVPSNYPYWYEEGFASYLSGMRFSDDEIVVGDVSGYRRSPAHIRDSFAGFDVFEVKQASHIKRRSRMMEKILTAKSLERWSKRELFEFYSKSWLLMHRLQLGHEVGFTDQRAALSHYVDLAAQGAAWDDAFEQAFGGSYKKYASLDKELRRYDSHHHLPKLVIPLRLNADFEVRQVACLDRAAIAYELGVASAERNVRFASKLFGELPREDVRAHIGRTLVHKARGQMQAARRSAARAVDLDAQNVLAKVLLASALVDTCGQYTSRACSSKLREAQGFFQAAHAAEQHRVDAVFGIGVTSFLLGEMDVAVAHLQQAYERAPWAPRINLFLGEAYRLNGDPQSALTHLTIAASWEVDRTWRTKARQALALIGSGKRAGG